MTGFQVASVHSIALLSGILQLEQTRFVGLWSWRGKRVTAGLLRPRAPDGDRLPRDVRVAKPVPELFVAVEHRLDAERQLEPNDRVVVVVFDGVALGVERLCGLGHLEGLHVGRAHRCARRSRDSRSRCRRS